MAQPIALTLPPRNPQRELDVRLEAAPAKHAEAILAAYEVLQLMHDKGVLELMRGTLGGGEAVVQQAVAVATDAASIRASRNALLLIKALGEVEPELLSDLTRALPKALVQANREEAKPPGLFKLMRTFFNADFRRGLAAFNDLLEMFGRNLTNKVRQG
ncbi:MAG TPA: DUF1641 domain-containing protein [Pyrinomonadaceae bacterium]|nr:DUF1641 domain-containing protein [Pyrinomonadaceae bacterium]